MFNTLGDVVEAVSTIVVGKCRLRFKINAHQVADRVFVFDAVESMNGHAARIGLIGIKAEAAGLDPLFQCLLFRDGWVPLFRRRHDVRTRIAQHLQPKLWIGEDLVFSRQSIECDASLMGAIAVAVVTPFLQNGRDDVVKLIQRLLFCQCAIDFCRRPCFLGDQQESRYRSDYERGDTAG
jgi:hypothetical protein